MLNSAVAVDYLAANGRCQPQLVINLAITNCDGHLLHDQLPDAVFDTSGSSKLLHAGQSHCVYEAADIRRRGFKLQWNGIGECRAGKSVTEVLGLWMRTAESMMLQLSNVFQQADQRHQYENEKHPRRIQRSLSVRRGAELFQLQFQLLRPDHQSDFFVHSPFLHGLRFGPLERPKVGGSVLRHSLFIDRHYLLGRFIQSCRFARWRGENLDKF